MRCIYIIGHIKNFVGGYTTNSNLLNFLSKYSVLARILGNFSVYWIRNMNEITSRIANDKNELLSGMINCA